MGLIALRALFAWQGMQKCVNVIEDLVGLNANVYICFIGVLLKRCLSMVYSTIVAFE